MKQAAVIFLLVVFHAVFTKPTVPKCGVIPMTVWSGADTSRSEQLDLPVDLVVIQHTVTRPCLTDENCEDVLKEIQDYQTRHLGFIDIGPSFLIGGNGKVYEGAGWNYVGAHTKDYNDKAISISFIGDFSRKLPTTEALLAAQNLLQCGVANRYLTSNYRLVGHRQLSQTQSPGEKLYSLVKKLPHYISDVAHLFKDDC